MVVRLDVPLERGGTLATKVTEHANAPHFKHSCFVATRNDENMLYVNQLHKTAAMSGTDAVRAVVMLAEAKGMKGVYLQDTAYFRCGPIGYHLGFRGTLATGKTWYERQGFVPMPVPKYGVTAGKIRALQRKAGAAMPAFKNNKDFRHQDRHRKADRVAPTRERDQARREGVRSERRSSAGRRRRVRSSGQAVGRPEDGPTRGVPRPVPVEPVVRGLRVRHMGDVWPLVPGQPRRRVRQRDSHAVGQGVHGRERDGKPSVELRPVRHGSRTFIACVTSASSTLPVVSFSLTLSTNRSRA